MHFTYSTFSPWLAWLGIHIFFLLQIGSWTLFYWSLVCIHFQKPFKKNIWLVDSNPFNPLQHDLRGEKVAESRTRMSSSLRHQKSSSCNMQLCNMSYGNKVRRIEQQQLFIRGTKHSLHRRFFTIAAFRGASMVESRQHKVAQKVSEMITRDQAMMNKTSTPSINRKKQLGPRQL